MIKEQLKHWKRGRIFFLEDVSDVNTYQATRKQLSRLSKTGTIISYGNGIYSYPVIDKDFGLGAIKATNEDIAEKYAKHKGIQLFLTPAAAQNQLGLSTQNQLNAIYYTDGQSRKLNTKRGNGIVLIHTSNNNLKRFKAQKMQWLAIALDVSYKRELTDTEKTIIARHIKSIPEVDYGHDLKLMKLWQQKLLMKCGKRIS